VFTQVSAGVAVKLRVVSGAVSAGPRLHYPERDTSGGRAWSSCRSRCATVPRRSRAAVAARPGIWRSTARRLRAAGRSGTGRAV